MRTAGADIGGIQSTRQVDQTQNTLLIKDEIYGVIGIADGVEVNNTETLWIGARGAEKYQGEFVQTNNDTITNISFQLRNDNFLDYYYQTSYDSSPYHLELFKGVDYHWSTIYIDPTNRELEQGVTYNDRKVLDVSFARTMNLTEKFLRMENYTVDGYTFECHVMEIDYGHVIGEIWVAKDELGWFLVYEDATATQDPTAPEGAFELVMDSYTRTTN
ncbi:hypothetical protein AAON49_07520 [Pseudotenacibaculum sp. MALMAid0570]|uniref:hypothetical protein n=1 Tax=Pseudotenacibaculum sp. MALMAid0570 TaxID=3143938 RepID=UPI0032DEC61F